MIKNLSENFTITSNCKQIKILSFWDLSEKIQHELIEDCEDVEIEDIQNDEYFLIDNYIGTFDGFCNASCEIFEKWVNDNIQVDCLENKIIVYLNSGCFVTGALVIHYYDGYFVRYNFIDGKRW